MAKQRMIDTNLWVDRWIRSINPLDRLLFVYLLTNEHTNISGIYELADDVMAFEVGLNIQDIHDAFLPRLEPKVYYFEGWIIMPKFPKHQNLRNPSIVQGIERELESIPDYIKTFAFTRGWRYQEGVVGDKQGGSRGVVGAPNLTKPNLTDTAFAVLSEEGENAQPSKKEGNAEYERALQWAEHRSGHKFINRVKQYSAIKKAKVNGIGATKLKDRWMQLEGEPFYQEKGLDWCMVVSSFDKKA